MTLLDGFQRQLRSVIQWTNPSPDVLLSQWTENGDEIKNASKLIVGPGQGCIFVYKGKVQSIIEKECSINLKTQNIPFWTTISKFMQFFDSENKVAIYFYKKNKILNQKWGTSSPIKYEDPKYNFPISLKAYGNYSYQINDPKSFFVNIVGGQSDFYVDDFRQVMSSRIIHPISDYLAENKYSYADIDANREEITTGLFGKLTAAFHKLGFDITDFRIEGTNFDDDTLRRINRISDLIAEAHAAKAVGLDYAKVQQLEAMRDAAKNEGGGAGLGMGMGAGIGLGQSMAQSINAPATEAPTSTTQSSDDLMAKLSQLKKMYVAELISEQEYSAKKKSILDEM